MYDYFGYKNSSGDEIANVNFFYDDIVHNRGQRLRWLNRLPNFYYNEVSMLIYAPNHLCTYIRQTELSEFVLPK